MRQNRRLLENGQPAETCGKSLPPPCRLHTRRHTPLVSTTEALASDRTAEDPRAEHYAPLLFSYQDVFVARERERLEETLLDRATDVKSMAKWGEGDPRWLVSERDDGANVNGWHWQERNCMGWGRERLTELLTGVSFEFGNDTTARVVEIVKFDGDASVTIRKGNKKFAVFDLSVTLKWEGSLGAEGDEDVKAVTGEIKLTEFASTNDEDEYEFAVTCSDGDATAKQLFKKKIAGVVAQTIQPHLASFAKELSDM